MESGRESTRASGCHPTGESDTFHSRQRQQADPEGRYTVRGSNHQLPKSAAEFRHGRLDKTSNTGSLIV